MLPIGRVGLLFDAERKAYHSLAFLHVIDRHGEGPNEASSHVPQMSSSSQLTVKARRFVLGAGCPL